MTKEEKRLILVLAIITIVVIGIVVIVSNNNKKSEENNTNVIEENVVDEFVQKLEDGSRVNVSEQLLKTKTLDGLEITNIQLKEIGGQTTLLADVENKTGSASEEKIVKILIVDKEGNTLAEVTGVIDKMQAGGKVRLNTSVTADVANAYDFKISNKK